MRNSGNQVDPSRDYLFESRLQRLLRDRGLQSLSQLVSALRSDPGATLQRSVAEAMTINETSFFRDTPTFDLLREQLLPALIERRRDHPHPPLLVRRQLQRPGSLLPRHDAARALPPARRLENRYPRHRSSPPKWSSAPAPAAISASKSTAACPPAFCVKYLVRTGDEWEIHPDIKRLCRFQQRNLCQPYRCRRKPSTSSSCATS